MNLSLLGKRFGCNQTGFHFVCNNSWKNTVIEVKFASVKKLKLIMRNIFYYSISALIFSFFLFPIGGDGEIEVTCSVTNCQQKDSLFIFEFNGISFGRSQGAALENNVAKFNLPQTEPRFYYVGLSADNARPVIIGSEKKVGLSSSCGGFRTASINDSDLNKKYEALKKTMTGFNNEMRGLNTELRQKMNSQEGMKEMHQKYVDLDNRKLAKLEKLKTETPYLAKVFALNTYMSFQVNGKQYPNELAYFAKEYFQLVDWNDAELNYMPWVFESMKNYSTTLSKVKLPVKEHRFYLTDLLAKIPSNTRTYQLALGGVLAGLEQTSHGNYKYFAEEFLKKYEDKLPLDAADIKKKVKQKEAMMIGGKAPDLVMNTPDGNPVSLASFRGKVTLIDFWASWCGPCKAEIPNLKKAYAKYHDKGFEIISVSTDRDLKRWHQALDVYKMPWPQLLDRKDGTGITQELYYVPTIPKTILLDKKGVVVGADYRGKALDRKLAELLD